MKKIQNPHEFSFFHLWAAFLSALSVLATFKLWVLQLFMMYTSMHPSLWFNPFNKAFHVTHEFDHWYCRYLCNWQEIMAHQNHYLRHMYGYYWCDEKFPLLEDHFTKKEE